MFCVRKKKQWHGHRFSVRHCYYEKVATWHIRVKRILSCSFYTDPVVLEASVGVEVEDKEHVCPVKHNDLVPFMLGANEGLEGKEERKKKERKQKLIKYFSRNSYYHSYAGFRQVHFRTLYQQTTYFQTERAASPHRISGGSHQQKAAAQDGARQTLSALDSCTW